MNTPQRWTETQIDQGHYLYLVLDSTGQLEERDRLLNLLESRQYSSIYIGTSANALAVRGPYIFQLDTVDHPTIKTLLQAPERHWGWLASSESNDPGELTRHWRDRLVTGVRPNQALYRFHDNRVLARALAHMPTDRYPEYLGPMTSVCYWQTEQWAVADNPNPGAHPVPAEPAWLAVPTSASTYANVQFDNVHRYLMAEHTDSFLHLARHQNVNTWLRETLDLAQAWGWREPDSLHFLLIHSLQASPDFKPPAFWNPRPDETANEHFERVYYQVLNGQGSSPQ